MAGWQSSNLVIRSESAPGMETCLRCREEDLARLAEARAAVDRGEEGAEETLADIQKRREWSFLASLSIPCSMLTVACLLSSLDRVYTILLYMPLLTTNDGHD